MVSLEALTKRNVFVSDINSGTDCNFKKPADNTQLSGMIRIQQREWIHPEGLGQSGEVGLCKSYEVQ